MKNNCSVFCYFIFSVFLFSCANEKGNEEGKASGIQPDAAQSIEVIVYNYNTRTPLDTVVVTMSNGQVTTPVTTTSANGTCNLPNVTAQNTYHFIKQGYLPQDLNFVDFSNLTGANLYLRQSMTQSLQMNLNGTTMDEAGAAIGGVRVSVGNNSTVSKPNGSYSFDVPGAESYQINYKQGNYDATLNLIVDQDTARIDVRVDGFSVDTLNVK